MRRLHTVSGSVILGAWAVSLLKGLIVGDYAGLDLTTPVMLVFAGYLFGDRLMRRRYEENGD